MNTSCRFCGMKYLLFFLAACSPQLPWSNAKPLEPSKLNKPDLVRATANAMLDTLVTVPQVAGTVRPIYGKTSCLSGPNPVWLFGTSTLPREGHWFRLGWAIEAVATPPPPTHKVAALVSFRPLNEGLLLTSHGLPGCMMLVHPDYILNASQNPNDIFYYNTVSGVGHIQLNPEVGMRGTRIYCQLVVEDPNGIVRLSSALELCIGQ